MALRPMLHERFAGSTRIGMRWRAPLNIHSRNAPSARHGVSLTAIDSSSFHSSNIHECVSTEHQFSACAKRRRAMQCAAAVNEHGTAEYQRDIALDHNGGQIQNIYNTRTIGRWMTLWAHGRCRSTASSMCLRRTSAGGCTGAHRRELQTCQRCHRIHQPGRVDSDTSKSGGASSARADRAHYPPAVRFTEDQSI